MIVEKRRKGQNGGYGGDLDDFTLPDNPADDKKSKITVRTAILCGIAVVMFLFYYLDVFGIQEIISGSSSFQSDHRLDGAIAGGMGSTTVGKGGHIILPEHVINAPPSLSESVQTDPDKLRGAIDHAMQKQDLNINFELTTAMQHDLETELMGEVQLQIEKLRTMKSNGVVMEEDEEALFEISVLQSKLREYLPAKYGPEPYTVELTLEFPDSMMVPLPPGGTGGGVRGSGASSEEGGGQQLLRTEKLLVQLAPVEFVPYSVYYFLDIVSQWKGGSFHRRAGHVLQAGVRTRAKPLAFQEYSPSFPHAKYTLGYAGRPGGPSFYISTLDNTKNHGPGSQGSRTEADSCFGKLANEDSVRVVQRMNTQPGTGRNGFISDPKHYIKIKDAKMMTSGGQQMR